MAMKGKPSIDAFLEGGKADTEPKKQPPQKATPPAPAAMPAPHPTVQKLFRLRWDTSQALKLGALHESTTEGRRITETELVEALIRERFKQFLGQQS